MHLWISEIIDTLFNGFPERLNADCLPPSFKLDQVEGEFLLELHLLIRGDAMNLSLKLVIYALCISQAPGCGFCLSMGETDLKLHSLVRGRVSRAVSLVFGGSFR